MASRAVLVGNRLALLGALLYLSEWLVIPFYPGVPTDKLGEDEGSIVAAYAEHPTKVALLTGWLSFVLLGRVVLRRGAPQRLARLAARARAR